MNKTSATVLKGSTLTLTPSVVPSTASERGVVWETSNPQVALVVNGVVTAIGVGTATITATAVDHTNGTITATCEVTVELTNSINNEQQVTGAIIFPNPASDILTVKVNNGEYINVVNICNVQVV